MNRRAFFKKALIPPLAAAAGSFIVGCDKTHNINTVSYEGRRLIIIRLDGGHDSLYAYAPTKHDLLEKLRPKLYKSILDNGITVADWTIRDSWKSLHELMMSGDARIIPNVGYPLKAWSGSHFGSADIWESGLLPEDKAPKTGWIGRLLDKQTFNPELITWPVVNLDTQTRLFDQGLTHTGISWMGTESYSVIRKYAQEYYHPTLFSSEEEYSTYLLHERLAILSAAEGYSQTELGRQCAYAESMIQHQLPVSVLHISQYGYDTHVITEEILPKLHIDLLHNLNLLVKRLKLLAYWNQTQIFIYSEFGRTLDENADGGTDHGTAGHVIALGGVDLFNTPPFNTPPVLQTFTLSGNYYLEYQVDFRDILRRYEYEWLV